MGEKIIFTTCTASYLALAKSLGDSIVNTNKGYKLCIGLVDKVNGRFDANDFYPHEITEAETIAVPAFDDMKSRYTLLELSCALKPWFALYYLGKFKAESLIYLDTDIRVTGSLDFINDQLKHSSVLLTPHILSPLPVDGKRPHETGILKTGIYNAGFFAVNDDVNGKAFLNWWKDVLVDYCYEDSSRGMASDQSWLNFVPLFFKNVKIVDHPGVNAAYWNLHEREIIKQGTGYIVNDNYPLIFYHYSGYSLNSPDLISKHQDRFSMKDNDAVNELFDDYKKALVANRHKEMLQIPCVYDKKKSLLKKLGLKK